MDESAVLAKTAKGQETLAARLAGLDRRGRQVLIMIDGKRRLGELTRVFPLPEILQIAELLLSEGLAEIVPSAASAAQRRAVANAAKPGVGDFPRARIFMVNTASHFVGVFASALIDRLERAESIADLASHRAEWRKAIAGSHAGSSQVESLAKDLDALLGR